MCTPLLAPAILYSSSSHHIRELHSLYPALAYVLNQAASSLDAHDKTQNKISTSRTVYTDCCATARRSKRATFQRSPQQKHSDRIIRATRSSLCQVNAPHPVQPCLQKLLQRGRVIEGRVSSPAHPALLHRHPQGTPIFR